jgi:cell cycle protein kinase DBF2
MPGDRDRDIRVDPSKWNNSGDIHMQTAKGWGPDDVRMETAKGPTSGSRAPPLKLWERELLESSEVKRKATVAQLCEWRTL